jgi:hypothetical protein
MLQKGRQASVRFGDWKDSKEKRQRWGFSVTNEKLDIFFIYTGLIVIKTIVCLELTYE